MALKSVAFSTSEELKPSISMAAFFKETEKHCRPPALSAEEISSLKV
jgi:hypothetical protein